MPVASLFFLLLSKTPLSLENLKSDKPRVRAAPDAPQAPCYSAIPLRFRMDSSHFITKEQQFPSFKEIKK